MLKVAICDDIKEYIKNMGVYVERFGKENSVETKICSYVSGDHLMLTYKKKKYDVIFLDISMSKMDGFETAGRIRKLDQDVTIIFCTAYYTIPNAQKAYEVQANDFLKKPIIYKKVESILNKVYKKKIANAEEKFVLKTREGIFSIQLSDIIYLETKNKAVILHTVQRDFVTYQKIYEFENKFDRGDFFRCHNSFLINLEYVESVRNMNIILMDDNKTCIPVSKYRKEELLKHLAEHIGRQLN